ncbi:mediator of RNA polymerase II transcription subunit 28-like [Diadema antillarum]|uniref:mediator of RNA polymerase II transcription subunit 28-like n=1 Tax=Diadema antillarum TaxID=105358 RepID=UPI003A8C07E3
MASHSGSSGDRHLVDELESAFKACLSSLVAPEAVHVHDHIELRASVDQSIQRFLELAKETENFFLQRQMLMAITKPENVIKEEIDELKAELSRKNALLQKQLTKVNNWLTILQSLECSGPPQPQHPQQLHHAQMQQQQLARGTMAMTMGPPSGMPQSQQGTSGDYQGQHHGAAGVGGGEAAANMMGTTPLSGPLAHLEQATSSIGGSGFDRR